MGIQIDLILPPVIIGLLIILIFRINAFMVDSSIDNRLQNQVQEFAELTTTLIQEEFRTLKNMNVNALTDSTFRFVNISGDSVFVQRNEKNLEIIRKRPGAAEPDTLNYPSQLKSLYFIAEPDTVLNPQFIRVLVETESNPKEHAAFRKKTPTVKAFSNKKIFLRNIAVNNQQ